MLDNAFDILPRAVRARAEQLGNLNRWKYLASGIAGRFTQKKACPSCHAVSSERVPGNTNGASTNPATIKMSTSDSRRLRGRSPDTSLSMARFAPHLALTTA